MVGLADWVGFDVKALPEDALEVTRVEGSGTANWRSLDHLLASGVEYECRTTVHWHLFDPERLLTLAQRLRERGVTRFAVQLVRTARMLDPHLSSVSAQALQPELWAAMRELFPSFVLRS